MLVFYKGVETTLRNRCEWVKTVYYKNRCTRTSIPPPLHGVSQLPHSSHLLRD